MHCALLNRENPSDSARKKILLRTRERHFIMQRLITRMQMEPERAMHVPQLYTTDLHGDDDTSPAVRELAQDIIVVHSPHSALAAWDECDHGLGVARSFPRMVIDEVPSRIREGGECVHGQLSTHRAHTSTMNQLNLDNRVKSHTQLPHACV